MRGEIMKANVEKFRKKIGKLLKDTRIENGKTMKKASYELSMDEGYLSKIENGKFRIPDNRIEDFIRVYELKDEKLKEFIDMYMSSEIPTLWTVYKNIEGSV
jgi:transcriptional regulator with XRE-family HTH domain